MPETCPYCDAEMKDVGPDIAGTPPRFRRYCPDCGAYRYTLGANTPTSNANDTDDGAWPHDLALYTTP